MEYLINENGSQVIIIRNYLSDDYAINLCTKLKNEVKWRKEPVQIRGQSIMQPRQVYACGDSKLQYTYSGLTLPVEPWIQEIKELRDRIQKELEIPFDSCLLNEYQNGTQYIGYHSNKEALGPENTVVTISLGGSRDFHFRTKEAPHKTIKTILNNGDCCIMRGNTQRDYTHTIPKRAHGDYRISLTFRLINNN